MAGFQVFFQEPVGLALRHEQGLQAQLLFRFYFFGYLIQSNLLYQFFNESGVLYQLFSMNQGSYLLFLNRFCQDMKPFYVPGDAGKIPFALHCFKPA